MEDSLADCCRRSSNSPFFFSLSCSSPGSHCNGPDVDADDVDVVDVGGVDVGGVDVGVVDVGCCRGWC